jgi:arylsulfatase A-like enzyme
MPTVLKLMDLPVPDRCLGRDLWSLVEGTRENIRDHVVTAFGNYASVRTRAWNYQTPWVQQGWDALPDGQRRLSPPELYDLTEDPNELRNVVAEHPDISAEYHGMLMRYIEDNRPLTKGSLHVGEAAFHDVPLFDQSQL